MSTESLELLKKALEDTITQTNRCIVLSGYRGHEREGQNQVRALFKTWICKLVRRTGLISYGDANAITDAYRISFVCANEHWQISKIHLSVPSWSKPDSIMTIVSEMFEYIDYEKLLYEPILVNSYSNQYSRHKTVIEYVKSIDFSTINNIKF